MSQDLISINELPCCPEVSKEPCCERLQFSYRLTNTFGDIPVQVTYVIEFERCPGPMSLGDVVYSTTLLPGEKVRLYTSTRNSRFTFDSESQVTYRHEQTSEETFYMSSMDRYMSDLSIRDRISDDSRSNSSFEVSGGADYWSLGFVGGGGADVSGNFSASSSRDFLRDLNRHSESSHSRSVQATRAVNAVQMGEVSSRSHAEGESETTYESSSRIFENRNQCHAVTYFAHQLVKQQTIRFRIKAVLRRVVDPAANSVAEAVPVRGSTGIAVISEGVKATSAKRLEIETLGRTSAVAARSNVLAGGIGTTSFSGAGIAALSLRSPNIAVRPQPIPEEKRAAALKAVDDDLVKNEIITRDGKVHPKLEAEFNFERTTCLPTQAIVIKGCIDPCNVCEESLEKSIQLDLVRKDLENKMLAKQIELLEKHHDYRCCPEGEIEQPE